MNFPHANCSSTPSVRVLPLRPLLPFAGGAGVALALEHELDHLVLDRRLVAADDVTQYLLGVLGAVTADLAKASRRHEGLGGYFTLPFAAGISNLFMQGIDLSIPLSHQFLELSLLAALYFIQEITEKLLHLGLVPGCRRWRGFLDLRWFLSPRHHLSESTGALLSLFDD